MIIKQVYVYAFLKKYEMRIIIKHSFIFLFQKKKKRKQERWNKKHRTVNENIKY